MLRKKPKNELILDILQFYSHSEMQTNLESDKEQEEANLRAELLTLLEAHAKSTILTTTGTLKPLTDFLRRLWISRALHDETARERLSKPQTLLDKVCDYMADKFSYEIPQSKEALLAPDIHNVFLKEMFSVADIYIGAAGKSSNDFVNDESDTTITELKTLLNSLSQSKEFICSGTLQPFVDFLANRWKRIAGTNADYLLAPVSEADVLCKAMAELLSRFAGISTICLLIPSLRESTNRDISLGNLHEYVLSADGRRLINCYDYDRYIHNPSNPTLKKVTIDYSDRDKQLIQAKVDCIKQAYTRATGIVVDGKSPWCKYLTTTETSKVVGSAGDQGDLKLFNTLHPHIETFAQLQEIMKKYSPQASYVILNEWIKDKLSAVLLQKKGFKPVLEDRSLYVGEDEHQAKLTLLAFAMLKGKELAERSSANKSIYERLAGENKSIYGRLVGNPTKDDKKPYIEKLITLLASDQSLEVIDKTLDTMIATDAKAKATFDNYNMSLWGRVPDESTMIRLQIKKAKEAAYRVPLDVSQEWVAKLVS